MRCHWLKGERKVQEGALFNKIKSIPKPEPTTEIVRENLSKVSTTGIALLHLKSKVEWFAEQKRGGLLSKKIVSGQIKCAC